MGMRYVESTDLRHLLAEQGAVDPVQAVAILASAEDQVTARSLIGRVVSPLVTGRE
jgi:hypothetical protein